MNDNPDESNFDVGKAIKSEKFDGVRISAIGLLLAVTAIPIYFVWEFAGQVLITVGILIGLFGFIVSIGRFFRK